MVSSIDGHKEVVEDRAQLNMNGGDVSFFCRRRYGLINHWGIQILIIGAAHFLVEKDQDRQSLTDNECQQERKKPSSSPALLLSHHLNLRS